MVVAVISAINVAGSARKSRMAAAGQDKDAGWLLAASRKSHKLMPRDREVLRQ